MSKSVHEIPYFKIMGKAFSLTWKNRYLGWFGFFVMLSNFSGFNYFYNGSNGEHPKPWTTLENFSSAHPQWLPIGLFMLGVLAIILTVCGIISRGALISSLDKLQKNKMTNLKAGVAEGKKYFWKTFFIALFSGFFILAILLILVPPVVFLFLTHNYVLGAIVAILAALIFAPLVILVAYLRIFGYLYAILGGLKSWAAIESAYNLFRKNIPTSLIMAIFSIAINMLAFFVIILALIPIALVILPLGLLLFILFGKIGAEIAGGSGLILLAVFFIYLRSFMEAFSQAAWLLFFHEIAAPQEKEIVSSPVIELETIAKPMPTINSEGE